MTSRRIPILAQIIAALGIPILVFFSLLGFFVFTTTSLSESFIGAFTHTTTRTINMKTAQDEFHRSISDLRGFVAYGNPEYEKSSREHLSKSIEIIDTWVLATKSATIKSEAQGLAQLLNEYTQASDKILKAKRENDPNFSAIVLEGRTLTTKIDADFDKIFSLQDESLKNNIGLVVKKAEDANTLSLTVGILLGAVIAALAVWYGRNLANRLHALNSLLADVGKLDLTKEDVVVTRNDELADMANTVFGLKKELRNVVVRIKENASQVAVSSEQLTAVAEQSAQAANQVATTITEVAEGVEQQSNSIDTAAKAIEHVSAGIQQLVTNNAVVTNSAINAAHTTKQGLGAVDVAVNQMSNIERTVNTSAEAVIKLGDRSKEIGQIVDTISGIAGQTNLLALNAAIEAARAGEQGRGFAVVAEEVRRLAEQSQDAAKQIADLINEIQSDTDKAVVGINEGTKEVKVGTEVVTTAGQAFRQIASLIEELSVKGQEIDLAIQKVQDDSQKIVLAINEIDKVSKNSAGQAQTVSAATEEQSASIEEIAASSQGLAKMSSALQVAIEKFRI
ncbi:methyl-accepting chemotaxis protein [Sporomusa aerivorans]|uniref:methyl-accepting chemotaxis protein n=1 Tax=Sporomusa aerivorans TaxID=204936 RepID=UPI00352B53B2